MWGLLKHRPMNSSHPTDNKLPGPSTWLKRHARFHLHAVALSDHGGEAEMFVTHDGYGSSMLDRGDIPEVKEHVRVPLYTLDELVRQRGLPDADVMKLDVQGAERLILSGGRRAMRSANILFVETWLTRGYGPDTPLLTEMIEFLAEAGFTLVDFGERFRDARGRTYSVFYSDRFLSTLQRKVRFKIRRNGSRHAKVLATFAKGSEDRQLRA